MSLEVVGEENFLRYTTGKDVNCMMYVRKGIKERIIGAVYVGRKGVKKRVIGVIYKEESKEGVRASLLHLLCLSSPRLTHRSSRHLL